MSHASTDNPAPERRTTLLLVIALCLAAGCSSEPQGSAEQQLRDWLGTAEEHAEAKERRALIGMISPSFTDSRGNKIGDIEDRLRYWFFRSHDIELLTSIDDIRVYDGSAAEMDIKVAMAGTDDSTFGFSADAYRYSLELVLQDDEWILLSADWKEIGE